MSLNPNLDKEGVPILEDKNGLKEIIETKNNDI